MDIVRLCLCVYSPLGLKQLTSGDKGNVQISSTFQELCSEVSNIADQENMFSDVNQHGQGRVTGPCDRFCDKAV